MTYDDQTPPPARKRRGFIRRFFGFIGRSISWLRVVLGNLLFLLIVLFIVLALLPKEPLVLPDEFALTLAPTGYLVDEESYVDPVNMLLSGSDDAPMETPVRPLIQSIDAGRTDPRVSGLVLELDGLLGGGISKLEEVGAALQRFKDSDKPIIALGSLYTQEQYYLASYADEIYLDPMGSVLLTGYANYRNYFKSAMDKLSVNFHVFRVGKYKDFIEPYTRDDMSPESREHNSEWLNQLWGVYTSRVEALRQLPSGAVNDYISNMDVQLASVGGDSAQLALESQLIDGILSHRERQQLLTERFGHSDYGDHYNGVGHRTFLADVRRQSPKPAADRVGLIVASGTISTGEQPEGSIGSDSFLQRLQQVQDDPNIKALVIRIDSGGGSAYASEVIRSEIAALRAEGMPVLVSMGSMAASGGYWMAAGADEIWATPTTLTGSIGVFGALPTFEDSLEKIGIHVDGVGTTPLAGSMRLDRTLTPQANRIIQQTVNHIYQQFIDLVAEARGLTPERVDQLGQGRVWTGATAQELGLVDRLGSLEDTLAAAAEHAELDDYEVRQITRPLAPYEQFLKQLSGSAVSAWMPRVSGPEWLTPKLKSQLAPLLEPLRMLSELDDPRAVYARCMECLAP
ncbi:protease-4 [Marinimicrobium koreense]|uniref:Protease-4 n=1 Tax=Marinimicrobium koreense TaxID=306545 RepID=A0A3N1P055_9GAMM|nr:signal peptide peptidase SppA [Marinimicrobium koreense]ROQ20617.1 protease-4 [Marinimicrobium koreense]